MRMGNTKPTNAYRALDVAFCAVRFDEDQMTTKVFSLRE